MRTYALLAALAGTLIAVVLGFVTFGAQATIAPDGVPLAVAAPEDGPLHEVAAKVTAQGGDAVSWRVASHDEARKLLADKEVYGILELGNPITAVTSGAVNPSGTQVAQQALTGAGQAIATALHTTVRAETIHQASAAGRTAPLAISALAWIGCLATGAVLLLLTRRAKTAPSRGMRLTAIACAGASVTAVLAGFLKLWDSSLPLGWPVLGFLLLAVVAFAALQAGLLRLLGVRAMAVLGPLYLVAPAVAGQVPELLNPAYRALLWSWTPFRFVTEGLRSLLQGTAEAPDVTTALWVLAAMAVAGLAVVCWPGSAREEAEPHAAHRVVEVGVH